MRALTLPGDDARIAGVRQLYRTQPLHNLAIGFRIDHQRLTRRHAASTRPSRDGPEHHDIARFGMNLIRHTCGPHGWLAGQSHAQATQCDRAMSISVNRPVAHGCSLKSVRKNILHW
jgi:hypothetical protein